MPRVVRAVCRKIDCYPWYEWVDEKVWEDDEFEDTIQFIPQEKVETPVVTVQEEEIRLDKTG